MMANTIGRAAESKGGGPPPLSPAAFDCWERFASSPAATILLAVWALAEATFWPIIPDFLLAPVAAGNRRRFRVPLVATIAGSAFGGAVLLMFAYSNPSEAEAFLRHLPLVTDSQISRATARLEALGTPAFLLQPWSGVPFKVWGVQAAQQQLDIRLVVPAFIAGRAIRMTVVAAICRVAAGRFRGLLRKFFLFGALAYLVLFLIGFGLVQRQ
jgi:1-acyl-sn-glycerol-3-phosphate acyltransferase